MWLDKLWDDVVAGPQPDRGLGKLRKLNTEVTFNNKESDKFQRSLSMPSAGSTSSSPVMPSTPTTPNSARKENVWRSVFHPGSNLNTKNIGAQIFDKPSQPSSPTVYDWLYSGETKSKYR